MICIDKTKEYTVGDYTYKNFIALNDSEKKLVWEWRNNRAIREWMTNNNPIPYEAHLGFIDNLKNRDDKIYWLVYKNNLPIGVLDIIDIDYLNKETEPGYYLNPELLNSGEGLFFNYNFRYFIFNILGFEVVKGNIKVGNSRAYTLSTFFGVRAFRVTDLEDGKHLIVRGDKNSFNLISQQQILKNFVRYAKKMKIDWDRILIEFS